MNRKRQRFVKKCAFFVWPFNHYMFTTVGNSLLASSFFLLHIFLRSSLAYVFRCVVFFLLLCFSSPLLLLLYFTFFFSSSMYCFCLKRYTNTLAPHQIQSANIDIYRHCIALRGVRTCVRAFCVMWTKLCAHTHAHRECEGERETPNERQRQPSKNQQQQQQNNNNISIESFMDRKSNRHTFNHTHTLTQFELRHTHRCVRTIESAAIFMSFVFSYMFTFVRFGIRRSESTAFFWGPFDCIDDFAAFHSNQPLFGVRIISIFHLILWNNVLMKEIALKMIFLKN